jgi:CO/xanthine dehydrogenase Mo-binding subunit
MARKGDRGSAQQQRVVLPGGHVIDMTPRGNAQRESGVSEDGAVRERALHVCPECESPLVHPVDWEPVGRARWRVDLRCPECEWYESEVHDQRVMDAFDEVLDEGTEGLLEDLSELSRAIMEEEVARFIDALQRDLVIPEDF